MAILNVSLKASVHTNSTPLARFLLVDGKLFHVEYLCPRKGSQIANTEPEEESASEKKAHLVIFVFISWGVNNVIVMSPLVQMSPGFEQANEGFYGSVLGIELIGSGLLAPVLEELVFRGIVYGSLRKITGMWPSVFISALLFGLVHFNIVQLIYALMLGIVLALAMEYVGNVYGAIVGHMAANTFAVLRTELNLGMELTNQSFFAWIVSVCILFLGIGLLYGFVIRKISH